MRLNTIWPFGPGTFAWAGPVTAPGPSRAIPATVASASSRFMAAPFLSPRPAYGDHSTSSQTSRSRRSWERRPGPARSAHDAVEPSVVQATTPGLTRGAVRDLVRLIGDPSQIRSARRTGLPIPPVNCEMVTDLGLEAAGSLALDLERFGQHSDDRFDQRLAVLGGQPSKGRSRRQLRAMQDVIRVPAPDPSDGSLVP